MCQLPDARAHACLQSLPVHGFICSRGAGARGRQAPCSQLRALMGWTNGMCKRPSPTPLLAGVCTHAESFAEDSGDSAGKHRMPGPAGASGFRAGSQRLTVRPPGGGEGSCIPGTESSAAKTQRQAKAQHSPKCSQPFGGPAERRGRAVGPINVN